MRCLTAACRFASATCVAFAEGALASSCLEIEAMGEKKGEEWEAKTRVVLVGSLLPWSRGSPRHRPSPSKPVPQATTIAKASNLAFPRLDSPVPLCRFMQNPWAYSIRWLAHCLLLLWPITPTEAATSFAILQTNSSFLIQSVELRYSYYIADAFVI